MSEVPLYSTVRTLNPTLAGPFRSMGQTAMGPTGPTSPQSAIKSSFSIALICTTSHRIPVSASTNQGPEKGEVVLL